ncbi:hypothetical protein, partial [Salmonella enterica]|uniref:hypothetical protein n=1 Tax=Salmonella enterica TaxID=28901 RepID=UPI002FCDB785
RICCEGERKRLQPFFASRGYFGHAGTSGHRYRELVGRICCEGERKRLQPFFASRGYFGHAGTSGHRYR